MGMGATNTLDRVQASLGQLRSAAPRFETAVDVPCAGVLLALPALLANGLLTHVGKYFLLPPGYYGIDSIFILLAFMALCRVKQAEQLRYCPPGEWGKLIGLDRIPEVRTLRAKLSILSGNGQVEAWGAELCSNWMLDQSGDRSAGVFYVDGHVRVYHGSKVELPRHYVARERLCLRATTDYWVNAMDGRPFFLVTQAVDPGLIQVLENQILPMLDRNMVHQPTAEQLEADPGLHRFTLVFDREGYSPDLMARLKTARIACITYRKGADEPWPEAEFVEQPVRLVNDNWTKMKLAERMVELGNRLRVREIRRLCDSGHQTSIVTTDYRSDQAYIAAWMFARWCQENYFRYMREHYNLDRLVDYEAGPLADTTRVVNPTHRRLDAQVRTTRALLDRKLAAFGAINLDGDIDPSTVTRFEQRKADLLQEVVAFTDQLDQLKAERKKVPRHIAASELPPDQRLGRLSTETKHFVDTIKMIAYRAETAMAQILHETMSRACDARSLLRDIYRTEADLIPDHSNRTLTVRLHHMTNKAADEAVEHLCQELNSTMTMFPGTGLRLTYELLPLVPSENPRGQEV
jgi:anti-sigma factor ChrR (cupin superfamily)